MSEIVRNITHIAIDTSNAIDHVRALGHIEPDSVEVDLWNHILVFRGVLAGWIAI